MHPVRVYGVQGISSSPCELLDRACDCSARGERNINISQRMQMEKIIGLRRVYCAAESCFYNRLFKESIPSM